MKLPVLISTFMVISGCGIVFKHGASKSAADAAKTDAAQPAAARTDPAQPALLDVLVVARHAYSEA